MNERTRPIENNPVPEVPKLDAVRLTQLVINYTGSLYDNLETRRTMTRNTFESLIEEIHALHPALMRRCIDLSRNINFGLGGDEKKKMPDAQNYEHCFVIGYGLLRDSYVAKDATPPPEAEQHPWFRERDIRTIADIFNGIGHRQTEIVNDYPDLVSALQSFVQLTGTRAPLAESFAALAAFEVHDSFVQMEAARQV